MAQKARWAPGPVWTNAKNFARKEIRFPTRPARSKSRPVVEHITIQYIYYIYILTKSAFSWAYLSKQFIIMFTKSRHLALSLVTSNPAYGLQINFLTAIRILPSHQRQGLPCGLFPSGFLSKTLYVALLSHLCATCPSMSSQGYYLARSTNHISPQCAVFSTPLSPRPPQAQISFSALCSNTLSLCSILNV